MSAPSVLFIDRTDYAGCDARRESRVIPYTEARRRLAEILRRVRSDIEVVVVRDRTLRFRVVHSYFLTNTVGPMRFERTISIEGSPSVRRPLPPLGNGPLRPDTEVRP